MDSLKSDKDPNKIFNKEHIIQIHEQFANNSLSPIILCDDKENILYANPAFCKLLQYKNTELISKNLRQFTNRVEFSNYQVNTYLRKKGIAGLYKSILVKKDETEIPVHVSASPVFDEEKNFICIMGIFTDLTLINNLSNSIY